MKSEKPNVAEKYKDDMSLLAKEVLGIELGSEMADNVNKVFAGKKKLTLIFNPRQGPYTYLNLLDK